MRTILVTGMSGTGKSTALVELGERGHRVVDTDTDAWSHWVSLPDGSSDWVWREPEMRDLLVNHRTGTLYVCGCKSNQGRFHPLFDDVVLLSAPPEVVLDRITRRDTNPYGKSEEQRAEILRNFSAVEPRLRWTASAVIDASKPVADVVRELEAIGDPDPPP